MNNYKKAMDSMSISGHKKLEILENMENTAKPGKLKGVPAAAIAICVCLALAGTALAAGLFNVEIWQDRESPVSGELLDGYKIAHAEAKRVPAEMFSQEVLADGAGGKRVDRSFDSWDEMEKYIGFDLMENPILAQAEKHHIIYQDREVHCQTTALNMDGKLTAVTVDAWYITKHIDFEEDTAPMYASLKATIATEFNPVDPSEIGRGVGYDETQVTLGEYTAANGLAVQVVTLTTYNSVEYYAHFTINGVAFALYVSSADPAQSYAEMCSILDSFVL